MISSNIEQILYDKITLRLKRIGNNNSIINFVWLANICHKIS
jgi:hypothetical protein